MILNGMLDKTNTASDALRSLLPASLPGFGSKVNEGFLADRGMTSRIHRRKPVGKPMPKRMARTNARKSTVRASVEHVFA